MRYGIIVLAFIAFAFVAFGQEPQQPMTDVQLVQFELQSNLNGCQARSELYRRQLEKLEKENAELKAKLKEVKP